MLFKRFSWKFPKVPRRAVPWLVALFMVITGGVILVGLVLWAPSSGQSNDVVLHFDPIPRADVYVNDEHIGYGTIEGYATRPGKTEIVISLDRYHDYRATIVFSAGESRLINPVLQPRDPGDEHVRQDLERTLGLRLDFPKQVPTERTTAGPSTDFLPTRPRGSVRREDIGVLVAEQRVLFEGRIVVKDEDGDELFAAPVPRGSTEYEAKLSPAVLAKLVVGRKYEWGCPSTADGLVSFEVVDVPSDRFARLHEEYPLARLFGIALLQQHDLHVAALAEAENLLGAWPEAIAFRAAWRSVLSLGLEESRAARRIQDGYAKATARD